ncbi:hypothetical protein SeMB42_g02252 [Synchytrium endobioticum]|uniref:THIF-type NAD/FAD binding fold domain-containing protein n=1 Tax=Synchytrium endobioticum TaxID=286115 RepID=A0A507DHS2_9FUNG|nr:hypothetical protein SeMB42_g02252 [Synchytrium endobioticum]
MATNSRIREAMDSGVEWLSSLSGSQQALMTFAAGAITATTAIFILDRSSKRSRIQRLKREIGAELSRAPSAISENGLARHGHPAISKHNKHLLDSLGIDHPNHHDTNAAGAIADIIHTDLSASEVNVSPAEEMLIREQLTRNYSFLGDERMFKIRKSFVIVVGLGGVGSHAAHMLVRSGVERIRLIDFDQVTLSSLNRHAVAIQSDVGMPKATCMKSHLLDIAPHAHIDTRIERFSSDTADTLLSGNPDYVLDCIDNIDTKVELIRYCVTRNLKIVASMGAGAKSDASRVQIADISDTQEDPLARAVRRRLRALGIENGLPVVYSTEKPGEIKLLPMTEDQKDNPDDYAALPDFRVRILPVLGTLPALFGCAMASHCITLLADYPTEPLAIQSKHATFARIHRDVCSREITHFKVTGASKTLTIKDVGYIFEEIWKSRSALSGKFEAVVLTRWDVRKPAGFGNLIALTKCEALKHEALDPTKLEDYYGKEFLEKVHGRFERERQINVWRDL